MKIQLGFAIFLFWIAGISLMLTVSCQKDKNDDSRETENISIPLVKIPAGAFFMGSPANEVGHNVGEIQHQVTLSAFHMSKYEITNNQYAEFLNAKMIGNDGTYPTGTSYPKQFLIFTSSYGFFNGGLHYENSKWVPVAGFENNPVIYVTWYGANEFAKYVGGNLPTEAQWEYACRSNTTTPFNTGDCLSNTQANYFWAWPFNTCTNTDTVLLNKTQPVGTYGANAYGLYDMHGNVGEWCSDWWDSRYPATTQTNPTGPATGTQKVIRGGGFHSVAQYCRSANRSYGIEGNYIIEGPIGFRIILVQ